MGRFENAEHAIEHCEAHVKAGFAHVVISIVIAICIFNYAPSSFHWTIFIVGLYGSMSLSTVMQYRKFVALQSRRLGENDLSSRESADLERLVRIVS